MTKSKAIVCIISFCINLLFTQIFKLAISNQEIFKIHIFLFSLSFIVDLIQVKFSKRTIITPSHFLCINFLRIVLCIIFLFPVILIHNKSNNIYIYTFLLVYFINLFSDIFLSVKTARK